MEAFSRLRGVGNGVGQWASGRAGEWGRVEVKRARVGGTEEGGAARNASQSASGGGGGPVGMNA